MRTTVFRQVKRKRGRIQDAEPYCDDKSSILKTNEVCNDGVLRTPYTSTTSNDGVFRTSISRRECDNNNGGTFDSSSSKLKRNHRQVKQTTFASFCERYELTGEKLGSGSFGSVYTSRDRESGTEYAVKIIRKCHDNTRKKVLKEIDICQRYNNCESIINLVEFGEIGDAFFLVFDKIEGGDLSQMLESRKRLSETEAARVISTIAHVLLTLHNDGVAHRDIKPDNILCQKKGEVTSLVLCDFGLASDPSFRRDSKGDIMKTTLTSPVGTPDYIAPEIVALMCNESKAPYDTSCDMWSLGVMLYKMLFGVMPFHRGCEEHRCFTDLSCEDCEIISYQDILRGDYRFPEKAGELCSDSALDLIQHLLVVDPQARYSAAEVLQHSFLTTSVSSDLAMSASVCGQVEKIVGQFQDSGPNFKSSIDNAFSTLKTVSAFNDAVLLSSDTYVTSNDGVFCTSISPRTCDSNGTFDSRSSKLKGMDRLGKQKTFTNICESYESLGQKLGSKSHEPVYANQDRDSETEFAVKIKNCDERNVSKKINLCQRYICENIFSLVEFHEIF
ncbi:MAP kinase-interacting serine/threonine-protein kinase 1-like [Aplysia californica]|uniref:MAP kinase-interacting serine/threonine-protein kinase 1-like n=1 Tax=Aplysia californica TaxID=6500 RepID=A0ABM0JND3_APLCA|nr:MAP kinase-interacting serine/threonine-protein kinase 1-like [Aplysia californica]